MKLYNSYSKTKETFATIKDKNVSIYVCGITPYDTTHLGHAFTYISFDALIRFLKFKGYKINYVQNVTDIDDDILRRAKKEDRDWRELGNYWTQQFLTDLKFLNVLLPDHYVKATDSIDKIAEIVKDLVKKKVAYEREGNVYFNINTFKKYGRLSKYTRQQMITLSKERGADPNDPLKKDPLDFILWQAKKEGEPYWKSPWGDGRPGWHIECSAMINKYLGDSIDIHGGGKDLIYPHHESEIAQSESYTHKSPFVKYWMHTSMVIYEGEKMSKSLGNMIMISDLSKRYSANEIRFMLLSNHYRKPWEFDYSYLDNARIRLQEIEKALNDNLIKSKNNINFDEFELALNDDLDTPRALDFMCRAATMINENRGSREDRKQLKMCLRILGFKL